MTKTKTKTKRQALTRAAAVAALTVATLNDNDGAPLRRDAVVGKVNEAAREVEVAFSSDIPVERFYGFEILSHEPGAIDGARLDNGAAVLWNHNRDDQIGVVMSWRLDDGVARAVLRFGSSARAEEVWRDIQAGIIRHVSVGYWAIERKVEEINGVDHVTLTKWEPFEISMVSVPADTTVGVGRGAAAAGNPPEDKAAAPVDSGDNEAAPGKGERGMKIITTRTATGALVRAKVDDNGDIVEIVETLETAEDARKREAEAAKAESTRTADILDIGEKYEVQALAAEAIRSGRSVDEFTREVLEHVMGSEDEPETRSVRTVPARASSLTKKKGNALADAGKTGMSEREASQFSFLRAATAVLNPNSRKAQEAAAFEYECSAAAEQSMGRSSDGIMVPVEVLTRSLNSSKSGTNPGDTGGYLIDTELATQSFISLVRNNTTLMQLGTPLGNLVGDLDIPRQTGSGNVYIVGEDQDVGEGAIDFGNVEMRSTTIGVVGALTRKMMKQSSMDVEMLFRVSLAADLGLGIDMYGYYGDGVGNNPLGVMNYPGVNAVPFAGVQPTYDELVDMETEAAVDNMPLANMRYVGNSRFRGHCKKTPIEPGTNAAKIWEQGGTVNGYETEITNQFPTGDVLFGDMRNVLIGLWGGLDITTDKSRRGRSGGTEIVLLQDFGIAVRNEAGLVVGRKAP